MTSYVTDKQDLMPYSKESEAMPNVYIVDHQQQPTGVLVTEPEPLQEKELKRGLILSIISSIICGWPCGAVATLLVLKTRLLMVDRKYAHTRHVMFLAWVFMGMAVVFGIVMWLFLGYLENLWF